MDCANLALPMEVMQHVMRVESSFNPYAIGVVGGRLARQPRNLPEAVATADMLEKSGFNFSLGLAQVNRYNLAKYGLQSYEKAFSACDNIRAGSQILRECYDRAGDWGKALSCYYSGNFTTGFRHGYVQKIMATFRPDAAPGVAVPAGAVPIPVVRYRSAAAVAAGSVPARMRAPRKMAGAVAAPVGAHSQVAGQPVARDESFVF